MKLGVIGLGLIGGSIARAFARAGWQVFGYDPNQEAQALASAYGIECGPHWQNWLRGVDQVVIASPLADSGAWIRRVALASPEVVVVEVSSVKGPLADDCRTIQQPRRLLSLHPMAGKEVRGFAASDPDLFRSRPCLVVNWAGQEVDAPLLDLWMNILGTRPVAVSLAEHDALVSLVSHMPYLISAALLTLTGQSDGECPQWPQAAGTGFLDTTRVGASDTILWAEILNGNRAEIQKDFGRFTALIDAWNELIQKGQWPSDLLGASRVRQRAVNAGLQGASHSESGR